MHDFEKSDVYPFGVQQGKVMYVPAQLVLGETDNPRLAQYLAEDAKEIHDGGEEMETIKKYVEMYCQNPEDYPVE